MISILISLIPILDTTINVGSGNYSGEGDIPLWLFAVSENSIFLSNGRDVFQFRAQNKAILYSGMWRAPLAFDDMDFWKGRLYALNKGDQCVYAMDSGGMIRDSFSIPYRYVSQSLYMFHDRFGVYLDMPGDSSYSVLEGRIVPDPVSIREDGGFLVIHENGVYRLPEDVVSVSFAGEDGRGRKYLMLERTDDSGIETGIVMLDVEDLRLEWLGHFEADGYTPEPVRIAPDGTIYLIVPVVSGVRILSWRAGG